MNRNEIENIAVKRFDRCQAQIARGQNQDVYQVC